VQTRKCCPATIFCFPLRCICDEGCRKPVAHAPRRKRVQHTLPLSRRTRDRRPTAAADTRRTRGSALHAPGTRGRVCGGAGRLPFSAPPSPQAGALHRLGRGGAGKRRLRRPQHATRAGRPRSDSRPTQPSLPAAPATPGELTHCGAAAADTRRARGCGGAVRHPLPLCVRVRPPHTPPHPTPHLPPERARPARVRAERECDCSPSRAAE